MGRALCAEATTRGFLVAGVTRSHCDLPLGVESHRVSGIDKNTLWSEAIAGCDVIVHLAARVHVIADIAADPFLEFRRVNVEGTLNLARQAANAGVRRFIFISSVKVNGELTAIGKPFRADDVPAPQDAYSLSKMEAENALRELATEAAMEVVIIRPPLVYGPGVKANFAVLMRWLKQGLPLPLGSIHNQRSLVALDNLVDLIIACLVSRAAANQTFMVSDGADVSTTQLLKKMGEAMGKLVRLLPLPQYMIEFAATLLGRKNLAQRLCGSLQVDIQKTRHLLGWSPVVTMDEQLKKMVEHDARI